MQIGVADPTAFLIGDPGYYGGQGLLWLVKGDRTIPHTNDPRWMGVKQTVAESPLNVQILNTPASRRLHVGIAGQANEVTMTVRDITGRSVKSRATYSQGSSEEELDVASLPNGIYLLEVAAEGHSSSTRFLIDHRVTDPVHPSQFSLDGLSRGTPPYEPCMSDTEELRR